MLLFSQIDADALIKIWPSLIANLKTLHERHGIDIETNVQIPAEDSDIAALLRLLKFVRLPNSRLQTAIKSLFVFSEVFFIGNNNLIMHLT